MSSNTGSQQGILLEAGTNEVEIIEFYQGGQSLGVNVAKVKQIVQFSEELLTKVPHAHQSVTGLFLFRNETITLVDLGKALGGPSTFDTQKAGVPSLVLVTEFNSVVTGFLIEGVNRIHRISWQDLQPMNPLFEGSSSCFTGSINIEGREILIADLEHIVADINPACRIALSAKPESCVTEGGRALRVILAEDSGFIRNLMVHNLKTAGFEVVGAFDNGASAFEKVKELKEKAELQRANINTFVDAIVTDIEMPQMDGLALCRGVKETLNLKIPVVIFSSLIDAQMAEKCKRVGANAYMSKPKIDDLRHLINKSCGEVSS